jgi:hypothetical protein
MRNILTQTRYGIAASVAVLRRAATTALGLGLAVTLSTGGAIAQMNPTLAPTAAATRGGEPLVQFASAGGTLSSITDVPTIDAAYSVRSDRSSVQPASFCMPKVGGMVGGNPCSPGCDVNYYVSYEALWLRREDDKRFSLSRGNFMPDFQFEFGGRYTFGTLQDCVNGWEASYVGPFNWTRQSTEPATGTPKSNLQALGGYGAAQISAFNSADAHSQFYRVNMQSFELNRKWWSWDVLSTSIGVRYVDYEEDYQLFANSTAGGIGLLNDSVDNELLGLQIGGDLLYPVSLRGNMGFKAKGGVYANFAERNHFISNAGTPIVNSGDSEVDIAGIIELGVFGNYHIVPSVRLTAAYEFWYMPGIATVPDQNPAVVTPASGTSISLGDEVLLHGGSVGVQVLF